MFTVNHRYIERVYKFEFDHDLNIYNLHIVFNSNISQKYNLNNYDETISDQKIFDKATFGNLIMEFVSAPYLSNYYSCDFTKDEMLSVIKGFNDYKIQSLIIALLSDYFNPNDIGYYDEEDNEKIFSIINDIKSTLGEDSLNFKIANIEYKLGKRKGSIYDI